MAGSFIPPACLGLPPIFCRPPPDPLSAAPRRCLVKNPDERATATELLDHPFIRAAQPAHITLTRIITEATEARAQQQLAKSNKLIHIQPQPADESQVRCAGLMATPGHLPAKRVCTLSLVNMRCSKCSIIQLQHF